MLTDIEEKIAGLLLERLQSVARVAIEEAHAVNTLKLPGVDVVTGGGAFVRVAQHYKLTVRVFVIVTFQHLRSTADRRKGVYPIVESIVALLAGRTLGLKIDGLKPRRLDNVTDEKEADEGKVVFQIEFETGFIIEVRDEATLADLLAVGLNYYLQDPTDDFVADAVDEVTLSP